MQRMREIENKSDIRSAIEELSVLVATLKPTPQSADIPTKPFLSVCSLLLQVLDKIGPTMVVLRQDIHQNIQRLEQMHETDPFIYANVVEILKKEAAEGNGRKRTSCSRAFVWLTRSLDFTVALLRLLVEDFGLNMEQAVEESYNITFKPWHGWISSAAYKVAIKLLPDSKSFITILLTKDEKHESLKEEMQILISLLAPFLEQIHSILCTYNLDRLKST